MIGNQNKMEEVEARGKGEHSYYKWRDRVRRGVEETVMQWRRSGKGCEWLWMSFLKRP